VSKTLASFREWWNAAVRALEESAGPAQQWGKLTDDDLMQVSGQLEEPGFDTGRGRSRASLRTDTDIRAWLVDRGLFDRT